MALKIEIGSLTQVYGNSYLDLALIVRGGSAGLLSVSTIVGGSYFDTLTLTCAEDNSQHILAIEKRYDSNGDPVYVFTSTPVPL